jgi:hypothetical protein
LRLKADIRIIIKNNITGKSHKIELIKFANNSRWFWLQCKGVKNSKKTHDVTLTQLCNRLIKPLKIIVSEL